MNIDGITNSAWRYLEPDESETDHHWDEYKVEEEKWHNEMSNNRKKLKICMENTLYGPMFPTH